MPSYLRILGTSLLIFFSVVYTGRVSADTLYGHGNFDNNLYSIDVASQTVTLIGTAAQVRFGPEMQISPDGSVIYMPNRVTLSNSELYLIDPVTGLNSGLLPVTYPGLLDTMVGMEFANGSLYAALARAGANESTLGTVDVGTGNITAIGVVTGIGNLGGMHFLDGTMYGATNGNGGSPPGLYTIDTSTAASTLVTPITLNGNPATGLTALAYCDGKMLIIVNNDTNLYSLNMTTGVLTVEFDMSIAINALTSVESATTIAVPAESFQVTAGDYISGGLPELDSSDNVDLKARRRNVDIQSRVFITVKATSPVAVPTDLSFILEGSVFARSTVNQSIDLFDYDSGAWEQIDAQAARRIMDKTVTASATGDLSRFVEPGTNCIEARVRFQSLAQRQAFSANVDQMSWTIGD